MGYMEYHRNIGSKYKKYMLSEDAPSDLRFNLDYAGRTDGQPVYIGYAPRGTADSDDRWLIYKLEYDGSGNITGKKTAYGVWNNRTAYTYD